MQTSDFDYVLPPECIAQVPATPRDSSRLLVVNRQSGTFSHCVFHHIGEYLRSGDLLVVNRSRVIPTRLYGYKAGSGGKVEALLLRRESDGNWQTLLKPGRRIPVGAQLIFEDPQHRQLRAPASLTNTPARLKAQVVEHSELGWWRLCFEGEAVVVDSILNTIGQVPLPPYIHQTLPDPERYQTVYANEPGSVAAPTAGLHFTSNLLAALQDKGIGLSEVTLHIGLDTFRPVEVEDLSSHRMHSEYIELDLSVAQRINATRAAGGRIIAVGTTSVRVLESVAQRALVASKYSQTDANRSLVVPYTGPTDLFITPGYRFRAVDVLLTNFHLPRSTLLVLVSAFAGRDLILQAYREAIVQGYRFYSFGDAMLLL